MSTWDSDPGDEERMRVLAIQMCRALAIEAEDPTTPLSAVADKALAIAELLMVGDEGTTVCTPRLSLIEGGKGSQTGEIAARKPLLTVIEGSPR